MKIRLATDADLSSIVDIQNWAIRNTTATFMLYDLTQREREEWLKEHLEDGFPVLVAEDETGILGYASYSQWNEVPGYRHTVENSIYVSPDAHGKGVGSALMEEMISIAKELGDVHVIIANIVSDNAGSLALHKKFGFEEVAYLKEVGRKRGKWLDIYLLQLTLPMDPHDIDIDEDGEPTYTGDVENPHV